MIDVLITLIIVALLAMLLLWVMRRMGLPEPVYTVAAVIVALLLLLYAVRVLGVL